MTKDGAGSVHRRRDSDTRYDLQGMRGIGVILVVIGHLYLVPSGAFAALDIFFVLSGFVITGVLLDMQSTLGRVYLIPFYLARARRLLPMGLFVTATTIALGFLVLNPVRGAQIAQDGFWVTIFWGNWHFIEQETVYFASEAASPFLHYWSLSVEEQIYFVWPLLLLGLGTLAVRRKFPRTPLAVLAVLAVGATSFTYSMWHSANDPTAAYLSTFDRVWEFAIGALLAVARPTLARIPAYVARPLAWVGLLSLAIPVFGLNYESAFPAPWGLLPCVSTAMVIAAGVGTDTRHLVLADNRVMKYVGDISYSVYLWHLPVIIYLQPLIDSPRLYEAAVLVTVAVLSVVFFHLIERPMRFAGFLMTPPERRRARRRFPRDVRRRRRRNLQIGWTAVVVTLVVAGVLIRADNRVPDRPDIRYTATADDVLGEGPTATRAERDRSELISDSLNDVEVPALDPPLGELGFDKWRPRLDEIACSTLIVDQLNNCSFGSEDPKAPVAVVFGDSTAAAWMPAMLEALPDDWQVRQVATTQCGAWVLPRYLRITGTDHPQCEAAHRSRLQLLRDARPDLLILSSGEDHVLNSRRDDLDFSPVGVAEFGLGNALREYEGLADRTVVLQPLPVLTPLIECVTTFGGASACVSRPSSRWTDHVAGERMAAKQGSADYLETVDWFCLDGICPGWLGGTPTTVDGTHLTIEASRGVSHLLTSALFAP